MMDNRASLNGNGGETGGLGPVEFLPDADDDFARWAVPDRNGNRVFPRIVRGAVLMATRM